MKKKKYPIGGKVKDPSMIPGSVMRQGVLMDNQKQVWTQDPDNMYTPALNSINDLRTNRIAPFQQQQAIANQDIKYPMMRKEMGELHDNKTYRPEHYGFPTYANGGFVDWAGENKGAIMGGLQLAGGAALTATGVGGPLGLSLMASGGMGLANEFMENKADGTSNTPYGAQQAQGNNVPTFGTGGMPQSNEEVTVELEKGEVFLNDDGIGVFEDDAPSHKEGGITANMKPGTKILGKLKDKDSGKMFKELGADLAKRQKKLRDLSDNDKSMYTKNAVKVMTEKLKTDFSDLFNRQEAMKPQEQPKEQFAYGGPVTTGYDGFMQPTTDPFLAMKGLNRNMEGRGWNTAGADWAYGSVPQDAVPQNAVPQSNDGYARTSFPEQIGMSNLERSGQGNMLAMNKLNRAVAFENAQPSDALPYNSGQAGTTQQAGHPALAGAYTGNANNNNMLADNVSTSGTPSLGEVDQNAWNNANNFQTPTTGQPIVGNTRGGGMNNFANSIGDPMVNNLMQLAPTAYNLMQGLQKPEKERLNDDYNRAISTLDKNRYNIDPLLERNKNSQAAADTQLVQSGAGSGRVGSGRLANLSARMRADASAYGTKNNADMSANAALAQGLFGRGGARQQVSQMNSQNEAARRNFLGGAASQVGEFAGRQQLMANQQQAQQQQLQVLGKYLPFFSQQFGDLDFVKQAINS